MFEPKKWKTRDKGFVISSALLCFGLCSILLMGTEAVPATPVAAPVPSTSLGKIAIIGDAGLAGLPLDNLKKSLLIENATWLVLPGDNLYGGSYASVWDSWKQGPFNFAAVALGNHNSGYVNEVKYFGAPGEYFSVVRDGARFLVLNSDNVKNVAAQFKWLEKELSAAQEKMIFIVYHHPTFTISKTHKWTEKKAFQTQMRRILVFYKSKITALLLGHDHMSTFMEFGDVPVVVSGSGREVRNEPAMNYTDGSVPVISRYLAPETQHWALLEIDEKKQIATVNFVRVSDQKRVCTAVIAQSKMKLEANCLAK